MTSSKPLIIFATRAEALGTLDRFHAKEAGELFTSEIGDILITGVGIGPAFSSTVHHLSRYDSVINIGFAGSLSTEEIPGTIYTINTVGKYTPFPASYPEEKKLRYKNRYTPDISLQGEKRLITFDFPLHCNEVRDLHYPEYELVDMEGWAIAYACQMHSKKCTMVKIVSDFANPNTSDDIDNAAWKLSAKLAEYL